MFITLEVAKEHLREIGTDNDADITRKTDAAEKIAIRHLNRAVFESQALLDAAILQVPAALVAAQAAYSASCDAADLIEDSELRLIERSYAFEVYRDARIAAQATRNGIVIDSAITAAMLLILGSLWEAREDVVIGASVTTLPFGAYAILNQWRKGPGL
jgi:hypothetical protein